MARVRAQVDVEGPLGAAEQLWHDTTRWPSFVDGFRSLVKVEGEWPREGARVVWDSGRHGRGRVTEEVVSHEPGAAQAVAVEDPRLRGTQRVEFVPLEDGTSVGLELDYQLKDAGPLQRVADAIFIRRAVRDSLRRTLVRFARELAAERELLR